MENKDKAQMIIGDVRPHKFAVLKRNDEIVVIERTGRDKFKIHRWGGDEDDNVYVTEVVGGKARNRVEHYLNVGWTSEFQSATTAKKLIDKLRN